MKNFITISILIFSSNLFAEVNNIIGKDINLKSERREVLNEDFSSGELITYDSIKLKLDAIVYELNQQKSILNNGTYVHNYVLEDRLKSSSINNELSSLNNEIKQVRNLVSNLELLKNELQENVDFDNMLLFSSNENASALAFSEKFSKLSSSIIKISDSLFPEKNSCKDYLIENNSLSNGFYRLKASDGSFYTTHCIFENSNTAYTLVSVMKNFSISMWGYSDSAWGNNYDKVDDNISLNIADNLKTKAWKDVSANQMTIFGMSNFVKINTINNVNNTMGGFFSAPQRTSCSTTYHQSPARYYPNPAWGVEYQDICYINYYKPTNYGGTGYVRLMLQFSAVQGGNPHNTSIIHWHSHRAYGFIQHSSSHNYSAFEDDNCVNNGSSCTTTLNPLKLENSFGFYMKESI